jgi:hypothetical protein
MLNCSTQLAQSVFGGPVVWVGAVVVPPVAELEELDDDADGAADELDAEFDDEGGPESDGVA